MRAGEIGRRRRETAITERDGMARRSKGPRLGKFREWGAGIASTSSGGAHRRLRGRATDEGRDRTIQRITEESPMTDFSPPGGAEVTLGNWQDPPFNRWAFQHMRELI